jgi:hypothetical protein
MTLSARVPQTIVGLTPGKTAEAPSSRPLLLPKALHPQLTRCHRAAVVVRPRLLVVIEDGVDVEWHGKSPLAKLLMV